MDRNIAALLRADAFSLRVRFQNGTTLYTYISSFPCKPGDMVVVPVAGREEAPHIRIAEVMEVDPEVVVEPNADIRYSWVIDVLDLERYNENIKRNAEIELTLANAYRSNLRKSFADQLLATVDDASRAALTKLLG